MDKRFYWLKLKRDFFKRHDIRIIEDMPNGKDYILFYLKLLVESIDHDGNLRFNDTIPYNEGMLSTITNTNIDIVRQAMKVFSELKLIDILEDKTIFMSEVQKFIGTETYWAQRKRIQRTEQKLLLDNVQSMSSMSKQERDKDIELDKDIDKDKNKRFTPPKIEEVKAYCKERNNNIDPETFIDYYTSNGWVVGKNKMKDWKATVRTWEKRHNTDKPKSMYKALGD